MAQNADIKLREQNYTKARTLLADVLEKLNYDFEQVPVRILLSRAYLGLGNPQEAANVLENLRPDYVVGGADVLRIRMLFTLGKLKLQLGDPDAAREYFTRFLAHWGDADWDLEEVDEAKVLLAELEQGDA